MKNSKNLNIIKIPDTISIDLDQTLDCGQSFRWQKLDDYSYRGIAYSKEIKITKKDSCLLILGSSKYEYDTIWKNYFDLDLDYDKIRDTLSEIHPNMKAATEYAPGIRILRQEPWEALCSFIISQNNNIPRIKGIISRLCENFGEHTGSGFSFPDYETLSKLNEQDLSYLRAGFRSAYILDAAKKVFKREINLEEIKYMPIDKARNELMKIKGVGPKVAECTLLYGMHRLEAFPLDVWMKRAMKTLFDGYTYEIFGEYAGIAQQYIFHYSRMNPQIFSSCG